MPLSFSFSSFSSSLFFSRSWLTVIGRSSLRQSLKKGVDQVRDARELARRSEERSRWGERQEQAMKAEHESRPFEMKSLLRTSRDTFFSFSAPRAASYLSAAGAVVASSSFRPSLFTRAPFLRPFSSSRPTQVSDSFVYERVEAICTAGSARKRVGEGKMRQRRFGMDDFEMVSKIATGKGAQSPSLRRLQATPTRGGEATRQVLEFRAILELNE